METLESNPITLVEKSEGRRRKAAARASSPRASVRALVFASDAATAAGTADVLTSLGYEAAGTVTALEALAREAERLHPDMLLLDFDADDRDAVLACAARIRERSFIPSFFLTECDDDETLARVHGCRPLGVLLRPFAPRQLRIAIEVGRERRALEQRLVQRQAFLETMFEWAGVGIAVLDERGAVLQTNRTLDGLLGLGDAASISLENLSHPDVAPRERKMFEALLDGTQAQYRFECRFLRANAEIGVGYVISTRLDEGDRPRVIRVMSDISFARLEKVVAFQEIERRLISSEIHDTVSQPLAAIFYQLQAVQHLTQTDPARAGKAIGDGLQSMQRQIDELSRLIHNLRSPALDGAGLPEALQRLSADFRKDSATDLSIQVPTTLPTLGRLQALFVYRIVQESLANVRRHAGASRATLSLRACKCGLKGRIEDDGKAPAEGYEPDGDEHRRHFGIRAMRERAELLGGKLVVTPRPEGGTSVVFEIPLTGNGSDD